MNIKKRLTQEIKAIKKRHFDSGFLLDLELSKERPNHFQNRINDIKNEMGKHPISKNWILDGCNDIMRSIDYEDLTVDEEDRAIWVREVNWIEEVIKANLKKRPEDEVWCEVKWFLQKYFLILEYKKFIKDNGLTIKSKGELGVNQIAIIYAYKNIQITRKNADEIAAKYGYTSEYSGEGLFQDYEFYASPVNRKGKPKPYSDKKMNNKIELFESIIEYLTDSAKQRAIDEIKILKTQLKNQDQ